MRTDIVQLKSHYYCPKSKNHNKRRENKVKNRKKVSAEKSIVTLSKLLMIDNRGSLKTLNFTKATLVGEKF